jgi:hypothetical protein
MGTADAVDREVAWLTTSGDGLPDLLANVGGPWDNIQAYWARTPATRQKSVYVLRRTIRDQRTANIRRMPTHAFLLKIVWPISTASGSAEKEQRALDDAIDLLLKRIDGPMLDKTHGGRFLSVAENPRYVDVDYTDPEQSLSQVGALRVEITYSADDFEINN